MNNMEDIKVGDVWQRYVSNGRIKIIGDDVNIFWIKTQNDKDNSYLILSKNQIIEDFKLIERDGKPYRKVREGKELIGYLCEVFCWDEPNKTARAIIKEFIEGVTFPYIDESNGIWTHAKELPKEQILGLKNFEE